MVLVNMILSESLIQEYYDMKNIIVPGEVMSSPDIIILHFSIYDKSGNIR